MRGNIARALVWPQCLERRLSQQSLAANTLVMDFNHPLGSYPDGECAIAGRHQGRIRGCLFDDGSIEFAAQLGQLLRTDTGANAADIAQFFSFRRLAQQQGAKAGPATLGLGEADHDELIGQATLRLDPGATARAAVVAVHALADDALDACLHRLGKRGSALADLMV